MINSETLSERSERINTELVAEEYRRKGYQVTRKPILDFLPSYRPDMVVEKNGEKKVIEVVSRSSMLGNDDIVELARVVYSQPGWSFDLHMIGEPEALDTPKSAESLGVNDILRRLEDVETVRRAGLPETALLLAWAACEAAIRKLMQIHGLNNARITATTHLLDQAAYHGIISRDDYFQLLDVAAFRNAFVHGFNVDEFDPELVSHLIEAVRNITEAIGQGPADEDDDDLGDFWPPDSSACVSEKPSTTPGQV